MSSAVLRAGFALGITLSLSLLFGERMIQWLGQRFREPIVSPSPHLARLRQSKAATPTMGGLFLMAGTALAGLFCCTWSHPHLQQSLLLIAGLTGLGACDDLIKLRGRRNGLSIAGKLCGQTIAAACVMLGSLEAQGLNLQTSELAGWLFLLAGTVVVIGTSNAVNLTDGLDGLAAGSAALVTAALAVAAYVSGESALLILLAGLLGGLLGFLKFNRHPARLFMGDAGSLPLGGLLGYVAVVMHQERVLMIAGGVLLAEAVSVVLQVGWFRTTGRRIFRCAPLHHHFEFLGWSEPAIVRRFLIVGAICALLSLWCIVPRASIASPLPGANVAQRGASHPR